MYESIPIVPILIIAIVSLLVLYGRNLEDRKKKYTYRELTPEEVISRNSKKNGTDIYGKRSSGHLDIDKFIKKHSV